MVDHIPSRPADYTYQGRGPFNWVSEFWFLEMICCSAGYLQHLTEGPDGRLRSTNDSTISCYVDEIQEAYQLWKADFQLLGVPPPTPSDNV